MKKAKRTILLVVLPFLLGCAYDARTVENFKLLRTAYVQDVADCKAGKLTDTQYKQTIELFDSAIFREEAKK